MSNEAVFEYTGDGQNIPNYVASVRFHSSVIEVRNDEFKDCE